MNTSRIAIVIHDLNDTRNNGGLVWGMKVIYDSGFGYELGHYVEPSKIVSFAHHINLTTGNVHGEFHTTYKVVPFTESNYKEVCDKYGYKLN